MCLVPKNQSKPKISNFNAWAVAWSNFLRVYSHFYPLRVSELIRYQSIIFDFASQFSFSAWLNYDRMFRFRMAQNPSLSWDRVDDDLYNRFLRHAPLQNLCYLCRNFGHFASACPLRAGATSAENHSPFRAPQQAGGASGGASSTTTRSWVNPAAQGATGNRGYGTGRRLTCNFYNGEGCQQPGRCRFEHVCQICYGQHPAGQCTKRP